MTTSCEYFSNQRRTFFSPKILRWLLDFHHIKSLKLSIFPVASITIKTFLEDTGINKSRTERETCSLLHSMNYTSRQFKSFFTYQWFIIAIVIEHLRFHIPVSKKVIQSYKLKKQQNINTNKSKSFKFNLYFTNSGLIRIFRLFTAHCTFLYFKVYTVVSSYCRINSNS